MSWGFRVTGDSGQVIVDDTYGVAHVLQRGTYSHGAGTNWMTVNFPAPVATQAPPMLFLNPNGKAGCQRLEFIGSAGAWTGFRFNPVTGLAGSGSYFAAGVNPPAAGDGWGIRVRDSAGLITFDSGWPVVRFWGAIRTWSRGSKYGIGSSWYWDFTGGSVLGTGVYFLANPFCNGRPNLGGGQGWTLTMAWADDGHGTMRVTVSALTDNVTPTFNWPLILASIAG